MRKIGLVFLFAAMGLLAGCVKEQGQELVLEGESTLEVSIAPDSPEVKTHMGAAEDNKRKVYWSDGDQISVNGNTSQPLAEVGETAGTALFKFTEPLGTAPYNILYPASIRKNDTQVTLPAQQTYKSDGFADGMFPMAGYSKTGSDIAIKHLCAVMKLNVLQKAGGDTDNLIAVRFSGKADEQVCGTFGIDYENATLTGADNDASLRSVKVVKNQATSMTEAVSYYIVVPAMTYASGIQFIIQDVSGDAMTIEKAGSVTLAAGKMYNMAEVSYNPSGPAPTDVEIASAEDLINFATRYNNKEFEGQDDLVVEVTSDITFDATTSSAFNAIGGIGLKQDVNGTEDYYFNGVFDGAGHKIGNFASTVPLFAGVGSNGVVKNIELKDDCTLTVGAAQRGYFAPVIGWNKGFVSGVVSHSDVTFNNVYSGESKDKPGYAYIGGLVAYSNGGTIVSCQADGDILCPASGDISEFYGYVGGIVSRTNGSVVVKDCTFGGNIKISNGDFGDADYGGLNITSGGDCKTFHIGGIAGYLAANGTIESCATATSKVIDIRGGFKVQQGGIAGHIHSDSSITGTEIKPTTNRMSVSYRSSAARANTTPTYIGGIVGYTSGSADLSRCTNYGPVSSVCQSTTMNIGGIAGSFGGDLSYCVNEETGTVTRTDQTPGGASNRYITMGGVVGCISAKTTFSYATNSAIVKSNAITTATGATIQIAGIAGGFADKYWYDSSFDHCQNSGEIRINDPDRSVAIALVSMGGILGASKRKTTFTNCQNDGLLLCDFSGVKQNSKLSYLGGIVGLIADYDLSNKVMNGVADVTFTDCTNNARVQNQNYNNGNSLFTWVYTGGIAAGTFGTNESKVAFTRCHNSNNASGVSMYPLRGIMGGIVGYGEHTTLDDCSVGKILSGNKNCTGFGGLYGQMVASTASNCTVSCTISNAVSMAGFAYTMDLASRISGCKVNPVTITKGSGTTAMGVFANTTEPGAIIENCGAKGTIDGAAISLSSTFINTPNGVVPTGTYIID